MAVFFDKITGYHVPSIQSSVSKSLAELNIDFRGKKSAFIKVNIVRPAKPRSCVVTEPRVVEALVNVLREKGIERIVIGEGPAAGVNVDKAFRKSGYHRLARRKKVRLLDLHRVERVKREWSFGFLELPLVLLKSDLYINVSKMKTHFHTGVTLSIKSQQGLLTPEAKKANHRDHDLHQSLVAVAKVVKPDLVIIDGIESMEGEGPTTGKKKHTKVMVYGDNMLEMDMACCQFMGLSPFRIEHLRCGTEEGLGPPEPEIKGEAFIRLRTCFKAPSPKPKQVLNFYSWKNYRACAEDDHCFEEAIRLALLKPRYWFTFFPKFIYFILFKRLDLLRGKKAKIPEDPGRVLCLGDCCRDTARKSDAYHVPGCPPKPEDIIKTISRMK